MIVSITYSTQQQQHIHIFKGTRIILSIRICFLILPFLCFFIFPLHYNQVFCSLLYISYYTRTHTEKRNDPVLHQFNIQQEEEEEEEDDDIIVLVLFPFFFVPPTNTHPLTHWDPLWQEKREYNSSYVLYIT